MSTPDCFIELTDECGEALLIRRDEIAMIRDCDPVAFMNSVVVLKSGGSVALQTAFKDVIERLKPAHREPTR